MTSGFRLVLGLFSGRSGSVDGPASHGEAVGDFRFFRVEAGSI